jgi:alanine racemase
LSVAGIERPGLSAPAEAASVLEIDLGAIAANWRALRDRVAPAECAAVVKADAYGLGAATVAPVLAAAGCRTFFVAHLGEGAALRAVLPAPEIAVLNGLLPGTEAVFAEHRLIPVLNDLGQLERWRAFGDPARRPPAILHVDTGMARLGLSPAEAAVVADEPERLAGVALRAVMSHLACADETGHPLNRIQLGRFAAARAGLPRAPASLAASSGIFLGEAYHFDLARPGVALYGVNPTPGAPNPMSQVVVLKARILQVRDVDPGATVGYGATHRFDRPSRVATVAAGYADGMLRSASNRGVAVIGGQKVPFVGRVSMDLITLDVSGLDPAQVRPGEFAQLIGKGHDVDDVARASGTIGYEVLTSLGRRYHRVYREAGA